MEGMFGDPAAFITALLWKVPALLIAVTVHELAHGVVADRLGDPTPRLAGRLTLNPIRHLDPFGALAFVVAGFGWAKPVPVQPGYFRHPTRDMSAVAAAGPLSNFVVAFVALVTFVLARRTFGPGNGADVLARILLVTFQFNLALGIFNLIPLPPLDGGHFLRHFVPARYAAAVATLEQYGPILLLILVISGGARYLIGPVFEAILQVYIAVVRLLL